MMNRILVVVILAFCGNAFAEINREFDPANSSRGEFWYRQSDEEALAPSVTLQTDVSMNVSGLIVRTEVCQKFSNPSDDWVEGIYVFPLPDSAAVDHLRMRVGARTVEGKVKEREVAKAVYTQAKQQGKKSSLIEQERPNIFTTSVANIPPGESIDIMIEYQQRLKIENGEASLRFPLVVAPRYIPGKPLRQTIALNTGTGWAFDTEQVADASRITPHVIEPGTQTENPVSISIRLNPGFPLEDVASTYHPIDVQPDEAETYLITLEDEQVPANRDFELVWRAVAAAGPRAAVFTEEMDGQSYSLAMLMPPDMEVPETHSPPREVLFVVDTSGSMHGASIDQAKQGLTTAVNSLNPRDKFNVIQFNSTTELLFPESSSVNAETQQHALRYIRGLDAEGGTEMLPALIRALQPAREQHYLRQIIFLTDGSVGNEAELFSVIQAKLGGSRLYTVGIGSAPNAYFMRKAADFGRGTFTYIGKQSEVRDKMEALWRQIEMPVLTDIDVQFSGSSDAEIFPKKVPDLYQGQPVFVVLKTGTLPDAINFKGLRGDIPWETQLQLQAAEKSPGVAVLWARKKIAELMDMRLSKLDTETLDGLKTQIVDIALEHHLVSRYTSLVAVDTSVANEQPSSLTTRAVKVQLPHGWSYPHVFGMPQTAAGIGMKFVIGMFFLVATTLVRLRVRSV